MIRKKKIYNRPVTNHAKERTLQRTDISLADIKKQSENAYKHGYKIRKFTGDLYEYLLSKQIDGGLYVVRVYEDNIYVFDSVLKRLLTIYPVPEEYLPVSNYFSESASPCLIYIRYPDGHYEYVVNNGSLTDDIGLATEFRTKQKATNYIKNNHILSVLERQGCEVIIMDIS